MLRYVSASSPSMEGRRKDDTDRKGFPYPPTNRSWVRLRDFTGRLYMETHLCYEIGTRPEEDDDEQ